MKGHEEARGVLVCLTSLIGSMSFGSPSRPETKNAFSMKGESVWNDGDGGFLGAVALPIGTEKHGLLGVALLRASVEAGCDGVLVRPRGDWFVVLSPRTSFVRLQNDVLALKEGGQVRFGHSVDFAFFVGLGEGIAEGYQRIQGQHFRSRFHEGEDGSHVVVDEIVGISSDTASSAKNFVVVVDKRLVGLNDETFFSDNVALF